MTLFLVSISNTNSVTALLLQRLFLSYAWNLLFCMNTFDRQNCNFYGLTLHASLCDCRAFFGPYIGCRHHRRLQCRLQLRRFRRLGRHPSSHAVSLRLEDRRRCWHHGFNKHQLRVRQVSTGVARIFFFQQGGQSAEAWGRVGRFLKNRVSKWRFCTANVIVMG